MMKDPDPRKLARTTDPSTSHEAAQTVTGDVKRRLYKAICLRPGLTRGHYEQMLRISGYELSKRLSDLVNDGLVTYSGELTSPVSGRKQQRAWPK